jgi:hypothetical protein
MRRCRVKSPLAPGGLLPPSSPSSPGAYKNRAPFVTPFLLHLASSPQACPLVKPSCAGLRPHRPLERCHTKRSRRRPCTSATSNLGDPRATLFLQKGAATPPSPSPCPRPAASPPGELARPGRRFSPAPARTQADAPGKKPARGWAGQAALGPLVVSLWAKFGPVAGFRFL